MYAPFALTLTTWIACTSASASAATGAAIEASDYVDRSSADCGLQAAIDAAAAQGGGVVKLPAGTFAVRRGLVLRDGVVVEGAGIDKTALVPARKVLRLDVVAFHSDQSQVVVHQIPPDLNVGSAVVACRRYPPPWYGSPRPAYVTAIDQDSRTITLASPYGLPPIKPGEACLTFGVAAALDRDVHQGDREIHLKNASLFRPGDEIALGEPPNESLLAHACIREVRANTLVLEEPARIDFAAWPDQEKLGNKKVNALVWALFPLIHGANVRDAVVRDLTIRGHGFEYVRPMQTRYTLAGIHLFNANDVTIQRVAVADWPSDGISLQTGSGCLVADCRIRACLGNGLHPGTGLTKSTFRGNLVENNGAGLYFCWHNRSHVIQKNKFLGNREGGITGLGNPGDRENVIEDNLIAGNDGPGIAVNGGQVSGNVIRNNVIENNSQGEPGKHPGIALYAAVEDARGYTIRGNTIRDTQELPTQHVGIEEKHGERKGKATRADDNVIADNCFSGHPRADVILAGKATRCEDNGNVKVLKNAPPIAKEKRTE